MKLDNDLIDKIATTDEIGVKIAIDFRNACRSISDYAIGKPIESDGSVKLISNGFMSTKNVSMLCATSGIGKSTWAYQMAMLMAQKQEAFGLMPTQQIKSLVFQWEDDAETLAMMTRGIQSEYSWDDTTMESMRDLVIIPQKKIVSGKSMVELFGIIEEGIKITKPNIVWLNPITAFFDGNICNQQEVTIFRKAIDRLAETYNVHFILIHHIAKMMKSQKDGKRFTEIDQYDGLGSSIFANWCRSMLAIYPTKDQLSNDPDKQLFCLTATKNASRLAWKTNDNKRTASRYMSYGEKNICWIDHGFDVIPAKAVKQEDNDKELTRMIERLKMGKEKALTKRELISYFDRSESWVNARLDAVRGIEKVIIDTTGKAHTFYIEEETF